MVRLFFCVVGMGPTNAASVTVAEDAFVEDVYEAIAKKLSHNPAQLTLYCTKRGESGHEQWLTGSIDNGALNALRRESVPADIQLAYLDDAYVLRASWSVGEYFKGAPQVGAIHILVKLREPPVGFPSRKRVAEVLGVDSTVNWRNRFLKTVVSADDLPPVSELSTVINTALPERIRITSATLSHLKKSISQELLDKLFEENDADPCTAFYVDVVRQALQRRQPQGLTKMSYVSFWDTLIHDPLEVMDCGLRFDRNSSRLASTATKRPDVVCTLHDVCVLRGEENDSATGITETRANLQNKIVWTFGHAPHLFGYATLGAICTLYALVASDNQRADTMKLASFSAGDSKENRLRLLLALLQLTRLFEGIVSCCDDAARNEFRTITRPNGVVIRLDANSVEKCFPRNARWLGIDHHLTDVSTVIKSHRVPHCDELVKAANYAFVFQPRGTNTRPKTITELFTALRQVLECLVALHAAGWMHRDLR